MKTASSAAAAATPMADARRALLGVYAPPEPLFVSGEGHWLIDDSGRRYLDFTCGIGVNALGGTTRGASTRTSRGSANETGRHSRGDGTGSGSSRPGSRFNDRGFGRLRDA